jgi:6-phosphogluconolactonase
MATEPLADRVAWRRVAVYFADERCVPPAHPDSNYRMAHESLLRRVAIPNASVHRIEGERADVDAAAREYERLLPASLDVLLLGMGADGHTASLFPHSPALGEGTRRVLPVDRPPPSPGRITITPQVIAVARTILIVVAGGDKAATVARAIEGPYVPDELPIQLALRGTWLIDDDAARDLRGGPS